MRLLCITAHPDDECFAFGGALALAAQAGHQVSVTCLTDGQAASNRGTASTPAELGQLRRAEFAASCHLLGVHHHEVLDYQDGQLEFADFSKTACRLVKRIRQLRPHIVLTFGGDGAINTHPDHTVVSALATAAFHWAGRPNRFAHHLEKGLQLWTPQLLYYLTVNYTVPDRHPISPAPYTVALDVSTVLALKMQAFAAHTTQAPLVERTRPMFEQHGHTEHYTLAAAPTPRPAALTTSLFSGVTED